MPDRAPARADAPAADADAPGGGPRRWPRRLALTALAAIVVLAVYGVAIEPRLLLSVQRPTAVIPDLPAGWEGREVAVISDLQVGMWWDNVGMAHRAVDALVEADPAAVLVLGDFVYDAADTVDDVEAALAALAPLGEAGIPSFAVLGNHDYDAGAAELLRDRLEAVGIRLLVNEAVAMDDSSEPLYVVGIGPSLPGEARPEQALADVPDDAARVVAMHNPTTFDRLPDGAAPLAVAGHTHGGQIRVPFAPHWSLLSLVMDGPVHTDGWIDGYGAPGNRLFVNRGIGMSLVPARINCTPAVTIFTLTAG